MNERIFVSIIINSWFSFSYSSIYRAFFPEVSMCAANFQNSGASQNVRRCPRQWGFLVPCVLLGYYLKIKHILGFSCIRWLTTFKIRRTITRGAGKHSRRRSSADAHIKFERRARFCEFLYSIVSPKTYNLFAKLLFVDLNVIIILI